MDADRSAEARTILAVERTMLAWWRTGLAALAVALAVGRLLPEIIGEQTTWPFVLLGLGFAVYASGLFVYGALRGTRADTRPPMPIMAFGGAGTVLALATIVLIAAG
jgi:uncharacterized membrane protein YidH (DUF202 family)